MDKVFVVIGTNKDGDNQWIAGVFLSAAEANEIADAKGKIAKEDDAAYTDWCERRNPLYMQMHYRPNPARRYIGVLTDEEDAEIETLIGPCPEPREWGEFSVIEVPVGAWGRYQIY